MYTCIYTYVLSQANAVFSEEEELCPLFHSARLRRLWAHSNTLYTILCREVYSLCRSTHCLWACLRPLVAIENNPLETSVSEHLDSIPRINRYYWSSWIWNIVTADPSFKSIPICPVCLCSNISLSSYESIFQCIWTQVVPFPFVKGPPGFKTKLSYSKYNALSWQKVNKIR